MPDARRSRSALRVLARGVRRGLAWVWVASAVAACGGVRADLLGPRCTGARCDGGLVGGGDGGAVDLFADGGLSRVVGTSSVGLVVAVGTFADSLCWADRDGVVISGKDGSHPLRVADGGGVDSFGGFAVRGGGVYWVNGSGVHTVGLDGSGYRQLAASCAPAPTVLDVDDTQVTWACTSPGTIRRVGLDGTGERELVAGTGGPVLAIASDETHLYWAVSAGVQRSLKDGAGVESFVYSGQTTGALKVDDRAVYTGVASNLFRVEKDRSTSVFLAPLGGNAIAIDDERVYLPETASVVSVPKTGGELQLVALTSGARAIAVDEQAVYLAVSWNVVAFPK